MDQGLGMLRDALESAGLWQRVNLVVTSDHGMAAISPERVVLVDDHIDVSLVTIQSCETSTCTARTLCLYRITLVHLAPARNTAS